MGFGRIYRVDSFVKDYPAPTPDLSYPGEKPEAFHYESADGADHMFCSGYGLVDPEQACLIRKPDGEQERAEGITFDGTAIRVVRQSANSWVAYPGNGTKLFFTQPFHDSDVGVKGWLLTRIETLAQRSTPSGPLGWMDIHACGQRSECRVQAAVLWLPIH
jgi:hypothetical protein